MKHECLDHLVYRKHEWIEPHGEPCFQAWWHCRECGEDFTDTEAAELCIKRAQELAADPFFSGIESHPAETPDEDPF